MKDRDEFSMESALMIQKEQLDGWKKVLKQESYEKLEKYAFEDNKTKSIPRDIFRGTDIDNWIHNNLILPDVNKKVKDIKMGDVVERTINGSTDRYTITEVQPIPALDIIYFTGNIEGGSSVNLCGLRDNEFLNEGDDYNSAIKDKNEFSFHMIEDLKISENLELSKEEFKQISFALSLCETLVEKHIDESKLKGYNTELVDEWLMKVTKASDLLETRQEKVNKIDESKQTLAIWISHVGTKVYLRNGKFTDCHDISKADRFTEKEANAWLMKSTNYKTYHKENIEKLSEVNGFKIPNSIKGVLLTVEQVKNLVNGKDVFIEGMTSLNGKVFSNTVYLDMSDNKIKFKDSNKEIREVKKTNAEKQNKPHQKL